MFVIIRRAGLPPAGPAWEASMRFLFLLWGDETAEAALAPEQRREIVEEHISFSGMLRKRGAFVAGEPLEASSASRIVRPADGSVVDGPFPETKEQLGGFYIVECAGLDEAVELARQLPASPGLAVEVRPIPEV